MEIVNCANLSSEMIAQIEREISAQHNLNDMMRWALSDKRGSFIPGVVVDVVIQDEFTHDVIVPWKDKLVIVYDTT